MHPGCFAPDSMHFFFEAKPLFIIHLQHLDDPENSEWQVVYFSLKLVASSEAAIL